MDTRAITRRLRDTGALNGIITTDLATPVEELVQQTKSWSILGKDLISEVRHPLPGGNGYHTRLAEQRGDTGRQRSRREREKEGYKTLFRGGGCPLAALACASPAPQQPAALALLN